MKTKPTYEELEKELRILKEKDKYQTLLDIAGVIFVAIDTKGIVTLVNKKACEIFGYEENEMLDKNWFENFVPERIKNEILPVSKKILSGEIETAEYYENPILTKNGEERLIYWHNTHIKDINGNITGHLSSGEDITERKKALQALKESEEKFRMIAENTSDIISIHTFDLKIKYLYLSPSSKIVTRYKPEELLGKSAFDFMHPEDKRELFPILKEYVNYKLKNLLTAEKKKFSKTMEIRLKAKSGEWRYFSITADIAGNRLVFISRDITEKKYTEKALKVSEEKYRIVANHTNDWEYWTDINGNFIYVSPSCERITGYKPKKFYDDKTLMEKVIHPDDRERFHNHKHEINGYGDRKSIEFRIITQKKETQWIGHVCVEVFGKDGKLMGIRGSNRLITKQKNAEIALKESESYNKALFYRSNTPLVVMDVNTNEFIDCNVAAINIYGYKTKEEVLGKTPLDVSTEIQYNGELSSIAAKNKINEAIKNDFVLFEWQHQRPNGDIWDAEVHLMSIEHNGKNILQFSLLDITERKKAEEALCESEVKYRTIFENTGLASVIVEEDTIISLANTKFQELSGYTAKQIEGQKSWTDFVVSEDLEMMQKQHEMRRKNSETALRNYEFRFVNKKNEIKDIFLTIGLIKGTMKSVASLLDITERKKAEQILKAEYNRFKTTMDAIDAIVYVADMQTYELLFLNKQAKDILGDKIGKKCFSVLQKGFTEPCKFCTNHLLLNKKGKPEEPYVWEFQNTKTKQWYQLRDQAIQWPDGRIVRLEIAIDITDRKKVEQALKESEDRFRTIFEDAPDAIFLADPKSGVILDANTAASQLLLKPREEIIGMNQAELHPSQKEEYSKGIFKKHKQESKKGISTYPAEINVLRSDGSEVVVEIIAQMIRINNKEVLQGTFRDITERKKMEEEIQLQSKIAKNIAEGVFLVKISDGTIVYTNSTFEQMFGYNSDELIGRHVSVVNAPVDKSSEEIANEIIQSLTIEGVWHGEIQNIKKDGTIFWCRASVSTFQHPKFGEVWLAIHDDITNQKKAEQALIESEKHLSELNATKDKFFSIIGHDLKNPMGNVLGFSSLLQKNSKKYNAEKIASFANIINNSAAISLELLEALLDWANIQTGKILVVKEKLCLLELINDVISKLEKTAALKKIKIEHKLSGKIEISADHNMFSTIMRNLLINAIKFTKRGGEVFIKAKQYANYTEIRVKDTGIGISVNKQSKLFRIEENVSTRGTEEEAGTGLGLILCKEFVEKHGGKIWVESKLGTGSEFIFTIPLD
ncbi:MAG: PAS domain S-box protein [Bacteroidales bacterium]|nr:PAS domain S-box protein [Bacteroidales bacterium]